MGCPVLSQQQYDEVAELVERGVPPLRIAEQFGISRGVVEWTALRLGADVPKHRRGKLPDKPINYSRKGTAVRQFTEAEDKQLLNLEAQGMRICDIAREMNRKPNSLRGRLLTLARREARAEDA